MRLVSFYWTVVDRGRLLKIAIIIDRLTTIRRNLYRLKNEPYRQALAEHDLQKSVVFLADFMK